jgi:aspartate racemase
VPDRTNFLLQSDPTGENPATGMISCATMLARAGARYLVVACNTAHAPAIFNPFCTAVYQSFPRLCIVNMLETCATYTKKVSGTMHIGLLATKGTHASRVYHHYFTKDEGFTLIEPSETEQEAVHQAIFHPKWGIKASMPVTPWAREAIMSAIAMLAGRGAQAVILGCTELPLAVKADDCSVPLLDPGLITARALIALVSPEQQGSV